MDGARPGISYPWAEAPARGQVTQVAEGVLWFRLPLPMALNHINIYALDDGDSWTVIDTGLNTGKSRAIWQQMLDGPLAGKPVGRVIVTHHHPDHIGLAGWFQTEQGAQLWTTRTAWLYARMLVLDEQSEPDPQTQAFWRSAGMDKAVFDQRMADRPFNFADTVAPLPLGYHRLQQDDVIQMGGRRWQVHIGHGHAPEQATFFSLDDNLVLGADQLLPSISPNLGVYPTEPDADPVTDWLESCARFGKIARADHLVLPGHKLPFTGLPTRLRQLIDNHHGALKRLEARLKDPATACDCFMALFKREITGGEYGLAMVEAVAHLNHLLQAGRVKRWRRDDGAWLWQSLEDE